MTSFCPLSAHPAHPAHPARRFALIASTVALGACQGATLPDRLPGLAAFYPDAAAAALIVPDTVRAGVPFAVTIQTLTAECRQSGRTDVVHAGQVAALTLYRDMACSERDKGVVLGRTVSLRFDTPGAAVVRVTAQGSIGPQTVERVLVVR